MRVVFSLLVKMNGDAETFDLLTNGKANVDVILRRHYPHIPPDLPFLNISRWRARQS